MGVNYTFCFSEFFLLYFLYFISLTFTNWFFYWVFVSAYSLFVFCVAVCTKLENATVTISVCFVGEGWLLMSQHKIILLCDFVLKVLSTNLRSGQNLSLISLEDLFYLMYFDIVIYGFYPKEFLILSCYYSIINWF